MLSLVLTAKEEAVEEKASTQRREQRQRAKERKKARVAEFEESQKRAEAEGPEAASEGPTDNATSDTEVTEVNAITGITGTGTYNYYPMGLGTNTYNHRLHRPRTTRSSTRRISFAATPTYCDSV